MTTIPTTPAVRLHTSLHTEPLKSLVPYARNSRTHSPEQVAQIAASLREFGFTNPVLIDETGGIIAGHGRVLAAQSLGMAGVPCLRLTGLSEAQKRAYVIADNKLALNAGWDEAVLAAEMQALQGMDFDLDLLGFDTESLTALLDGIGQDEGHGEGLTDPDDVPAEPVVPVSKLGNVWLLGKHRLMCGDSTDSDTVNKLLGGGMPHLMVTDPPYGVEYAAGWRNDAMPEKNDPQRWKDGTGRATGAVLNDERADWKQAWELFEGDVAYVWHTPSKTNTVLDSLQACGFKPYSLLIWAKNQLVIGRGHYHPKHEPCWYVVRKGATGHWQGDRKQTTLWEIDKPRKSETGHSTQKPIECMRKPIENNSAPGDAVYEPFSGSGTTIIAAEQTARICYAMELSPQYVDVAVTRWQNYTGKTATLEATGQTFEQVKQLSNE